MKAKNLLPAIDSIFTIANSMGLKFIMENVKPSPYGTIMMECETYDVSKMGICQLVANAPAQGWGGVVANIASDCYKEIQDIVIALRQWAESINYDVEVLDSDLVLELLIHSEDMGFVTIRVTRWAE